MSLFGSALKTTDCGKATGKHLHEKLRIKTHRLLTPAEITAIAPPTQAAIGEAIAKTRFVRLADIGQKPNEFLHPRA